MTLHFRPAFIALGLLMLCACASTPTPMPAAPAATPTDAATGYVIGPGDLLKVNVLGNPELNVDAPVRPDGKISMPLIKEISAVGKTPTELGRDIENGLKTYLRSPSVSVTVQQARGLLNQVKVIGQVGVPGSIPFRSGMTVMDAVLEAKGLSQFAAGNRAAVIRQTDSGSVRIKVRLEDLMSRGDMSQNIPLKSGDVVIVPEARF
ncbi:MAG TPA: XrtA/PEP-CTERM system exopolysaccharide export protein [Steroidobacteraceae bacterium]|nr:XrtA/PEP-CTERM system exopolysaccharide export protein [Steroidobacteraceae bacterium]